ncbi:Holliday junction resolvase RuvX [Candidatus Cloacimonadota bacterium]
MTVSRLLGIDYGSVRIGLALSDPLKIISRPYKVILNRGEETFQELEEIVSLNKVEKIILGLPLDKDGSDSEKTLEVRRFAEELSAALEIEVVLWDERYTSSKANSWLKEMGIDYRKSKTVIDKIAASIILKDFLEGLQ